MAGVEQPVEERYEAPHERPWQRPWQSDFLRSLSLIPDVTSACRYANVSRTTVYERRGQDDQFAVAWDECLERARDLVEHTAHSWITSGVPVKKKQSKTVTKRDSQGAVIEEVTTIDETETAERSATLMIFWLKANYPERYRFAEKVEATGADGGPLRIEKVEKIDAEIAALSAELNKRAMLAGHPPVPVE